MANLPSSSAPEADRVQLSPNEAIRAAMQLHDPKITTISLRGKDYIPQVGKSGCRRFSIYPYEFITQNPKKASKHAELARKGHKLTWIFYGKACGLIQDGKIEKKSSLINPSLPDWTPPESSVSIPSSVSQFVVDWSQLKIGAKLGSGAFGEVKRGQWLGTHVAVKLLHSSDAALTFFEEASLLCALRHPNIVSCLGVCTQEPNLAIVMELMEGNLAQTIKAGPLSLASFLPLAIGITRGIAFLHQRKPKIIHRDIKPENILIDSFGTPKLGDFGVSKESIATMTQTKIGTPSYAAPELLNSEAYGTAVDIYSMSMVMYSMATGVGPFADLKQGERKLTPLQVMMKVAVHRQRPIIPSSVDPALASIIRDCWDHEPKKRPTALKLLERLETLQESLTQQHNPSLNMSLNSSATQSTATIALSPNNSMTQIIAPTQPIIAPTTSAATSNGNQIFRTGRVTRSTSRSIAKTHQTNLLDELTLNTDTTSNSTATRSSNLKKRKTATTSQADNDDDDDDYIAHKKLVYQREVSEHRSRW